MLKSAKLWISISIVISMFFTFQVHADDIIFKFDYPDNLAFTQSLKTTKKKISDTGESQVDSSISDVFMNVNKSDSGYNITATPTSMKMYRNGQLIESPIVSILTKLVVTYRVDNQGQLLDIIGYDQFLNEIEKTMPVQVLEVLKSVVNKDVMVAKETEEWNGRIGGFTGASIKLGDIWKDTTLYQLPSSESITYYTATSFDEWVEIGGKKCLKVSFSYDSDPGALAGAIDSVMSKVASVVSDSLNAPKSSVSQLFGSGYRLIDPSTMMIYQEFNERTMKLYLSTSEQKQSAVTSYETREYSFKYTQ